MIVKLQIRLVYTTFPVSKRAIWRRTTKRTEHFFCAFRKIAKGKARISFLWEQSLTAHTRRSTVANIRRSSNLCKQKGGPFPPLQQPSLASLHALWTRCRYYAFH